MAGKVWLIGAGPSDMGLFTIKGKEILSQAEVVVYDRLVGEGILNLIPQEAEAVDVGKRAGNHTMPQEDINRLLLQKAQEGKKVVRLKGGDPFLFGRGGEELELLAKHNIAFEIVPGITSAIAVPAYNGIPVTHRDYASSVHIITGHKRAESKKQGLDLTNSDKKICSGNNPLQIDFEALVRLQGTLVFLMGISALEDICNGLTNAGMDKAMPAAVLQQGTSARQKKIIADLEHLPEEVKRQGIETPAIIVVGRVCELGNSFQWYERLPLFGKKILVTRPRERSGTISAKLRTLGAEVLELPAIRTEAIKDNQRLQEELEQLSEYQYLVFTSPAGVTIFFDELRQAGKDIRSIGTAKIAAIGQGTRKELENRGLICDLMPKQYDGAHLGILLGEVCRDEERILIPRAEQGNEQLIEEIKNRTKAQITDLPIYRTIYENPSALIDEKAQIEQGKIQMAVFTSASTVKGFAKATEGLDYRLVNAVCIGTQTESAAKALGMKTVVSERATIDSLVEACVKLAAV